MRYLDKAINRILRELIGDSFYLFLDFDGTLAPIRKDPEKAQPGKKVKDILKKLMGKNNISIALVSGRGIEDIKKRICFEEITYAGNHGFELSGPHLDFVFPSAKKSEKTMKAVGEKLRGRLKDIKGVIVEDKRFSLSVHYRMVDKKYVSGVVQEVERVADPYLKKHKIKVTKGKKVIEIRPPAAWDKGRAVKKLLKEEEKRIKKKIVPLCMGDDKTDEDIFKLFKSRGYTVKITKDPHEKSEARYYLKNITEVREFLSKIAL